MVADPEGRRVELAFQVRWPGMALRRQRDLFARPSHDSSSDARRADHVQAILDLYGQEIQKAATDYGVAPELIVMTIATETGFARSWDFTGPRTFRWEPHVGVNDVTPHTVGDYSAGPMQTLATTAREVIHNMGLT
jgi:hypothetical protein